MQRIIKKPAIAGFLFINKKNLIKTNLPASSDGPAQFPTPPAVYK